MSAEECLSWFKQIISGLLALVFYKLIMFTDSVLVKKKGGGLVFSTLKSTGLLLRDLLKGAEKEDFCNAGEISVSPQSALSIHGYLNANPTVRLS